MAEEYRRLLDALADETLKKVAVWRMEGHTEDAIAARLGCARRTVRAARPDPDDLARRRFLKSGGTLHRPADMSLLEPIRPAGESHERRPSPSPRGTRRRPRASGGRDLPQVRGRLARRPEASDRRLPGRGRRGGPTILRRARGPRERAARRTRRPRGESQAQSPRQRPSHRRIRPRHQSRTLRPQRSTRRLPCRHTIRQRATSDHPGRPKPMRRHRTASATSAITNCSARSPAAAWGWCTRRGR